MDGADEPLRTRDRTVTSRARQAVHAVVPFALHALLGTATLTIFKRSLQCTGQRSVAADQFFPAQGHAFAPAFFDQFQTLRIDDQGICLIADLQFAT